MTKSIKESRPLRFARLTAVLPSGIAFTFRVEWSQGWFTRKSFTEPDWTEQHELAAKEACRRFERELSMEIL